MMRSVNTETKMKVKKERGCSSGHYRCYYYNIIIIIIIYHF
jgi:hypothetical protein